MLSTVVALSTRSTALCSYHVPLWVCMIFMYVYIFICLYLYVYMCMYILLFRKVTEFIRFT